MLPGTSWLSGGIYERIANDISLLQQEVAIRGLLLPEISDQVTKNDYIAMAAEKMGMSTPELTRFLWATYNPSNIWYVYSGVAVSAVVLLWIYNRFILEK